MAAVPAARMGVLCGLRYLYHQVSQGAEEALTVADAETRFTGDANREWLRTQ